MQPYSLGYSAALLAPLYQPIPWLGTDHLVGYQMLIPDQEAAIRRAYSTAPPALRAATERLHRLAYSLAEIDGRAVTDPFQERLGFLEEYPPDLLADLDIGYALATYQPLIALKEAREDEHFRQRTALDWSIVRAQGGIRPPLSAAQWAYVCVHTEQDFLDTQQREDRRLKLGVEALCLTLSHKDGLMAAWRWATNVDPEQGAHEQYADATDRFIHLNRFWQFVPPMPEPFSQHPGLQEHDDG